jgi:hypothetical protein
MSTADGQLTAGVSPWRRYRERLGDLMPPWVGMQYALSQALGIASPERLDNDRYPDITWTGADDVPLR